MSSTAITRKLWGFCDVLMNDGMSCADYVEQLTYLLFLKMADERARPPYNRESPIPAQYRWETLLAKDGEELKSHYEDALKSLAKRRKNQRPPARKSSPARKSPAPKKLARRV